MPPTMQDPTLAADAHPVLSGLFLASLVAYTVAVAVALVRPLVGRWLVAVGALLHTVMTVGRGIEVAWFPLNNKLESFSGAALAMAWVAVVTWRPSRVWVAAMGAPLLGLIWAAWTFPLDLRAPIPVLVTIWYPLHVPLSFAAYALWTAAAAAGIAWAVSGPAGRDPGLLLRVDRWALQGFGLWSVSMIFGGIWGVVAWGAWFLWDPKVIWSVILWFHYASFIHLRLTPSLRTRPWVRPALAVVGFLWVFVAYIGTSFFFGGSSHAF